MLTKSDPLRDERDALTRDLLAEHRRLREKQQELRAQQHSCEIILQRAKYLSSEQRDETLARYEEVTRALNAVTQRCNEIERDEYVRAELERAVRAATARGRSSGVTASDCWSFAKPAPDFLAEEEPEFEGLARDLLAPGAITMLAAPKGLGKTQVAHALCVALAKGGVFRGERVKPARVLLLDRENPRTIVKKRLRAWGADNAHNLHVLTRENAPELRDEQAWRAFPAEHYDVIIIDSVGSATEGITEREGKQTTEVLALVRDLAAKNLAVLLLQNTTKDGSSYKGREEWADRVDILYEVRDATSFLPSGKKAWWLELPAAGAASWAERAARRRGRIDYRLAFIPAKFRLGAEPDPFCLEIHLPEEGGWAVRDVTRELMKSAEDAVVRAEQEKTKQLEEAARVLAETVEARAAEGTPFLKSQAEMFLRHYGLKRWEARELLAVKNGVRWRLEKSSNGRGAVTLSPAAKKDCRCDASQTRAAEQHILADRTNVDGENQTYSKPAVDAASRGILSSPLFNRGRRESELFQPASDAVSRSTSFSPPEEFEMWQEIRKAFWKEDL